jgi:hypothetical protein
VPGYDTGATVWYIAPFSMTLGDPPTILDFDTVTYTVSGANISWQAFDAIRIIYGVY